ncbi:MAG: ABC transporter permease [Bacteroidales bacterium]|nr:ABC transporter permease [Bacteroidales bacterium]
MTPFIAIVRRETKQIFSNPTYWFATLILPLFILSVMATMFGNGLIRELPVGIVDNDNSQLSRSMARNIESVPELHVTKIYSNIAEAKNDMQAKKIYGYIYICKDFERNIKANRKVELPFFYHFALLSVGGEVLSGFYSYLVDFATLPLHETTQKLNIDKEKANIIAMPVTADFHPLNNPSLDYIIYLSFPYFYVILQILILLTIAYCIGREFKENSASMWLTTAGNNRIVALYGKLTPYFVIYSIISCFANVILFKTLEIPIESSILSVSLTSILFVAATISVSVFIFSIHPNLASIIGFISMFGSLGATMVGVTFPIQAMPTVVEWASYLFPARHFTVLSQNLCYEGLNLAYTWQHYATLLLFCLLPFIASLKILPPKLINNNIKASNNQ